MYIVGSLQPSRKQPKIEWKEGEQQCPFSKKKCNERCAWYEDQQDTSCKFIGLLEDIVKVLKYK